MLATAILTMVFLVGSVGVDECQYPADGSIKAFPCVDEREQAYSNPEQWRAVSNALKAEGHDLVGHVSLEQTRKVCNDRSACQVGKTYHTTNGDVRALQLLAGESASN